MATLETQVSELPELGISLPAKLPVYFLLGTGYNYISTDALLQDLCCV